MRFLVVGETSFHQEIASLFGQANEVSACQFQDGLTKINLNRPDVIILDLRQTIELPSFLRQFQQTLNSDTESYVPILVGVVAHEARKEQKIKYYRLGFEVVAEYPIDQDFLQSNITVIARRCGIGKKIIQSPHLMLEGQARDCFLKTNRGELLAFFKATPMQFELIKLLAKSPRRVWGREELVAALNNHASKFDNRAVDTSINRLRERIRGLLQKLPAGSWEKAPLYKYPFVQTEYGVGYFFLDCLRLQGDETLMQAKLPIRQAGLQIEPNYEQSFPFNLEECRYY